MQRGEIALSTRPNWGWCCRCMRGDSVTIMMIAVIFVATEIDAKQKQNTALRRLRRLANLLDSAISIPGTRWRIGLDPLIGLIPGAGDAVAAALSIYIVVEAYRLGVRRPILARMLANVAIDFLVGVIPVLGDVFDAVWKCNARNLQLLEMEIAKSRSADPSTAAVE